MANNIETYKPSWQENLVKNLVKNQTEKELATFVYKLITFGCAYTGQNKTDEDIKIISCLFVDELKKDFEFLTTSQIETALKKQGFGEYGITVKNLIKCLTDYYPYEKQKENQNIEKQLQKPAIEQATAIKDKPLDRKEKVAFLRKGFDFWKRRGYVADVTGDIWKYSKEIAPNYKPTFSDKRQYFLNAKTLACEYFFNKNKLKYGLPIRVAKDKQLLASDEFKQKIRQEYREFYLRVFFKRSKWNENQ